MKKLLLTALVVTSAFLATSAEAHGYASFSVGLGFYGPAPSPPAPVYYATPAAFIEPPYPYQVVPVGCDQVRVVYFAEGMRHSAYFSRTRWEREGRGAWNNGHR